MTESLMQRIEKLEMELASIKAEAENVSTVDISSLKDGVYLCSTSIGTLRVFFMEGGVPSSTMGTDSESEIMSHCRGHRIQELFDLGLYHSLKKVTSLEPLL